MSQIKRERNANFRKAGKKAMLFLADATKNKMYPPQPDKVQRRSTFTQIRSAGFDRKYCNLVCEFVAEMRKLIKALKVVAMNSFQTVGQIRFKQQTCRFLTQAKGDESFKIKLNFHVPMTGQYQLMCHEGLLGLWRELSEAIEMCRLEKFSLVEISNIQLSTEILDILLPSLTKKVDRPPIPRLVLNSNLLGKYEISALASFVNTNNGLSSLEVSGSPMLNPTSVKKLSIDIFSSKSMKTLKLEQCLLGQSISSLTSVITSCTNLKYVYLSGNHIGSDGAVVIAQMIAGNHPVEELYLNDNELCDQDMVPIAKALQTNTNLRKLFLRDNLITYGGEVPLLDALFNEENILTIFNSNHTCQLFLRQDDVDVGRCG